MNKQLTVNHLKKLELADIKQRKQEVLTEINLQKEVIVYSAKRISPFSSNTNGGSIFKKVGTGVALFDGAMMGYKIIKKIKKLFRRK